MTNKEFRELTRAWFKDLVKQHGDVDRRFARLVGLTATEVNAIMNDKRYPSWTMIEKVTSHLNIRTDDLLIDLIERWRKTREPQRLAAHPTARVAAAPAVRNSHSRKH